MTSGQEGAQSRLNPAAPRTPRWAGVAVLLLAVALVYGQTLWFDFVNYDDFDLVVENSDFLSKPSNILTSFTTHAFTSHRSESVYYRPLLLVSYILDYQIWGLRASGYHLTNLILHAFATVVCFFLMKKIVGGGLIPLSGALLFALHPIQTESVAWIAGRNDILLGLFVLLMVFWHLCARNGEKSKGRFHFLSMLAFCAAVLTKESAVFFILLLPLYDLCLLQEPFHSLIRKQWTLYTAIVAIVAGYFTVRYLIFGTLIGAEKLYGALPILSRVELIPAMITEHLGMLCLPIRQSVVRPLENLLWTNSPWSVAALLVALLLPVILVILWRRHRPAAFGVGWLIVGLLPILNLIPVAVPILEHRLYVPFAGFALGLISALSVIRQRTHLADGVWIALLLVAALGSFLRVPVWRNSLVLWTDAIDKAPNAARAYFNLAGYHYERREYEKTIQLLGRYVELKPEDFLGYSKLRQTYYAAGRMRESADVGRQMIALDPRNPARYIEAGTMFESLNLPDTALAIYDQGLRVDSTLYELHARMGMVEEGIGHRDLAARHYRAAIGTIEYLMRTLVPPREVVELLATMYEKIGDVEHAKQLLRQLEERQQNQPQ